MKKKLLSLALAVVLVLSCVPVIITTASAESASLSFSSVTFKGYKGWMNPSAGGQERYKQRSYDLGLQAGTLSNILSGTAAQAQSNNVGDYYPELYLNASGNLVRDNRYDNVNTTINLATYLAEGYGKYYGVFTFEFSSYVLLDTFTVYNREAWWHLNRGFDILYSADGTTWIVAAEYRNMGTYENWDSATPANYLGQNCLHRTTNFGGAVAKYVAVAVTDPAGGGPCCALWYATATRRVTTEINTSTIIGLKNAITYANANSGTTIKLTSDITCGNSTSFGTISGANTVLDGQNHTIYNLRQTFGSINGAGVTVKNLTISNQTSSGGSNMSLTGVVSIFDSIASGTSANPVTIQNVTNQRNITNVNNYCGQFARQLSGYVTFTGCTNTGNLTMSAGDNNFKIGGFVGLVNAGANVTFTSCANMGNVSGSQTGGFIGVFFEGGATITMTDCSNSGTITGKAGSSGFGIAGGLIGGNNNTNSPTSAIRITLTRCTNSGNVLLDNIADHDKAYGVGGLIGVLSVANNSTTTVSTTIDNCGVYGCTIDATDTDHTQGDFYAAPLIGKAIPQNNANFTVTVKNSYASKVTVSATYARKYVGVGATSGSAHVTLDNCISHKVSKKDASNANVAWELDQNSSCRLTWSAATAASFAKNDTGNLISGGAAPQLQRNNNSRSLIRARLVASLPATGIVGSNTYERVGFFVVAIRSGETETSDNIWNVTSRNVYSSIKANGETVYPTSIHSGDGYFIKIEVDDIERNIGTVTFYATPYLIEDSGRIIFGQGGTGSLNTNA